MAEMLVIGMCLIAILIGSAPACLFAGVVAMFHVVFDGSEGIAYFWAAILCDLFIICVLAKLEKGSSLIRRLHIVCIASILLGAYGACDYINGGDLILYNKLYFGLYLIAAAVLIKGEGERGYSGEDSHSPYFRRSAPKRTRRRFQL